MAARSPCGNDACVDSNRRYGGGSEAADDCGVDRIGQTISRGAVSVGRDVQLWIRLLRVHADASQGARHQYATRCGSAGGLEGSHSRAAQGSAGGGSCFFWFFREGHHAYRDVHWRRSIHSRHHQWTSRRSNQPIGRRAVDAPARRLPKIEDDYTLGPLRSGGFVVLVASRGAETDCSELPVPAAAAIAWLLRSGAGCLPHSSMTSVMRCVSCCMAICQLRSASFSFAT